MTSVEHLIAKAAEYSATEDVQKKKIVLDELINGLIAALEKESRENRRDTLTALLAAMEKLKPQLFVLSPEGLTCKVSNPQDVVRADKRIDLFARDWMRSFRSDGCFYDVGSNVGTFGIYAAKTHGPSLRTYAFEFHFPTFATLCANVIANGVEESVLPLHLALGRDSGVGTAYFRSLESGSALHQLDRAVDYKGDAFEPGSRMLACRTSLDTLRDALGFQPPDYLKIDTDGNEYDVVLGARETLSRARVLEVLVEFVHPSDATDRLERMTAVMQECGLSLARSSPRRRIANLPIEDLLFTKG